MDPVGPWSYTYNRLATVQPTPSTPSSGDFHHHLATIAAATAHNAIGGIAAGGASSSSPGTSVQRTDFSVHPATSQLLLQSGFSASNFLATPQPTSTPSNIAYETVFSPFLHAAPPNPKPAHYNNIQSSHRHRTDAYQQQPAQQQHLSLVSQQQQQQPQSSRTR